MTRKDYIAIAAIIREDITSKRDNMADVDDVLRTFTHSLAEHFRADNPRFDRDRFMIAAGVPRS